MEYTTKQQKTIEDLKRDILHHDGLGAAHKDNYEYKRFDVELYDDGRVGIIATVGQKGDEGTMAALYCRTTRIIILGKHGGTLLANAKKKSRSRGYWNATTGLVEKL